MLAGGDRIVVIPGNPEGSELWRRITGVAHPRMPFDGPPWLPDDQIARIRAWIAEGAMDDAGTPAPIPAGGQVRFRGVMTGAAEIDGAAFAITGDTRIDDRPPPVQRPNCAAASRPTARSLPHACAHADARSSPVRVRRSARACAPPRRG